MKHHSLFLLLSLGLIGCTFSGSDHASNGQNNGSTTANVEISGSAGGETQAARAEAIVADLYKQHDAKNSPFFQTKDRARVHKYFTKQLADLIWKDAITSNGEVGALDADPLYDTQEMDIKNLKIGTAEVNGDKATVPVTFLSFGEKKTLKFSLAMVNQSWKIADINYGRKETLVAWLRPSGAETENDYLGDFQGKFIVGETSCTVEYKNKGYAVKWAKGRGDEYFSLMAGTTFASSTVESEANKFVFDDDNYDTGTFYRTDGKTFPVRRVK
jgi:hypothetical protein